MSEAARVTATSRQTLSPWVTLVSRTVARGADDPQVYHSLSQSDYVSVLALSSDGRIPLVRQFRPAVQRVTLELPGGLLDSAETPGAVAVRELQEEAGFAATGEPVLLGKLVPDTGRLENSFWSFFVRAEPMKDWHREAGVERVVYTEAELREAILGGGFDHALHVALIGLAVLRGHLRWPA